MPLWKPDPQEGCECTELDTCMHCDHKLTDELHYEDVEQFDFETMDFISLGPMHISCTRYRLLGYCGDHTRMIKAGSRGLN